MIYGSPTSVPFGDNEELYLERTVKDAGEGAYVTISHPAGWGNQWSALVGAQRTTEIVFVAEGETKARFVPYDLTFPGDHAASAYPLGDWDSAGDIDVTIGQVNYLSDKGGSVRVAFDVVMQVAEAW